MFNVYPKLPYRMVQQTAEGATKGKWYAKSVVLGTLTWDEFMDHVATHNSTFDKSVITAVMSLFVDTATEVMASGYKVRLGDLGSLRLAICAPTDPDDEGKNYVDDPKDFNPTANILAVKLAFSPNRATRYNLTRKVLANRSACYNVEKLAKNYSEVNQNV